VHGLARRKGELNPMKWGFTVDDSILDHKKMKKSRDLPPRDKELYKEWKKGVDDDWSKREKSKVAKREAEKEKRREEKGPGLLVGFWKKKGGGEKEGEGE
ncbi:hypothetical protein BDZ45DRAFT_588733, partial [Acephala macrosclerotiorum]